MGFENNNLQNKEEDILKNILINSAENEIDLEIYKKSTIKKVKDGVFLFSIDGKNIINYKNNDGEILFNLKYIRDISKLNNKIVDELVGYKEVKNEEGIYDIYKIVGKDKNGNILLDNEKIDIFTEKYYEIFVNKDFFSQYVNNKISDTFIESYKERINKGQNVNKINAPNYSDETLNDLFDLGVIRIKNIENYYKNNQITKEQFEIYFKKFQNILIKQIFDYRFEKVNDIVTKEEIEEYKKNNYIDENLYKECIKLIKERDEIKQEKEKNKDNILKNTQSNLIQEKSEFNV
ncbi:MAG: hypothetical protein PHR68_04635 [Candidatus Gracilibacteria bacterium]|nr:hypothetical protein [Candidatus Gracilibacteria bacterium]